MKVEKTRADIGSAESGLLNRKYHVALSFAGEDRVYVKRVAAQLIAEGAEVFYDEFEEATLWGKNLYTHLRDVYENKALFTVIFISEHYKNKVWQIMSWRALSSGPSRATGNTSSRLFSIHP